MNPFLSAAINAWIAIASFDFFVGKWRYLFFLGFLCGINILVVFSVEWRICLFLRFFMSKSMHLGSSKKNYVKVPEMGIWDGKQNFVSVSRTRDLYQFSIRILEFSAALNFGAE
jgi:hypothetical protein